MAQDAIKHFCRGGLIVLFGMTVLNGLVMLAFIRDLWH